MVCRRTLLFFLVACVCLSSTALAQNCAIVKGVGGRDYVKISMTKMQTKNLISALKNRRSQSARLVLNKRQMQEMKNLLGPSARVVSVIEVNKENAKRGYVLVPKEYFF